MEFKNATAKEEYEKYVATNSKDEYSKGVVDYEKRWVELMEKKLAEGQEIETIAKATSNEADTEGITGFMYGCAVSSLSHFWKHGEKLRQWHNLDTQIGNEGEKANESGGVLNPALLSMGKKE